MSLQDVNYAAEVKYSKNRLFILGIVFICAVIFFKQALYTLSGKILYEAVLLLILAAVSLFHYIFLLRRPASFQVSRRVLLLFLDLLTLTFTIAAFDHYGLFWFPLYIILIMQNGLYFGIRYFYTGLIFASLFWILLLLYSPYWQAHSDIVATFAFTTFLIPLFYLNYIIEAYQEKDALSKELSVVAKDAYHDSLTGLSNRISYEEALKTAFKTKQFFTLFFIDLNKFKAINDTYGHHAGDEVLKEVARRLQKQMDEEDFLARLGGDEFAIISRKKKVFLAKFIQKIEKNVIGDHMIDGHKVRIELSIGISMYPDDATSSKLLEKYADAAMYTAKNSKGIHHAFHPKKRQSLREALS
jgi:diguanylate cyclase (GGDEF)-like protein